MTCGTCGVHRYEGICPPKNRTLLPLAGKVERVEVRIPHPRLDDAERVEHFRRSLEENLGNAWPEAAIEVKLIGRNADGVVRVFPSDNAWSEAREKETERVFHEAHHVAYSYAKDEPDSCPKCKTRASTPS